MTPNRTVALALRLFAIWLGIQALGYVPAFFSASDSGSRFVYMSFMLALNAVIILVLWVFPQTIAGKLLPSAAPPPRTSATPETLLAVGCTLIGLWTLASAVPGLVYYLSLRNFTDDPSFVAPRVSYEVVKLIIGLWLVLGGRGVGKIFRWAQYVGIRKDL